MSELEIVINKLRDEQSQLFQKLYRLDDFLVSGIASKNVSSEQINLMWMQRNAMKMYIDILQLRIDELSERIRKEESEVE